MTYALFQNKLLIQSSKSGGFFSFVVKAIDLDSAKEEFFAALRSNPALHKAVIDYLQGDPLALSF